MEIKKSPKVNLENFKSTFSLIGIAVSLIVVYFVFSASSKDQKKEDLKANTTTVIDEEQVAVTRQDLTPPPPPQPQQQVSSDIIQVVNNDVKLKDVFDFNMNVNDESVDFQDVNFNANTATEDEPPPVIYAEQMPEFPGGNDALRTWIGSHTVYPPLAQENDIQGTVYLRFVVTTKGNIGEVQIVRGVDPLLDQEAVRVVKLLPQFKPGMQAGRPVAVWYSVPIVFQLNN